jgi:hypothetical protein
MGKMSVISTSIACPYLSGVAEPNEAFVLNSIVGLVFSGTMDKPIDMSNVTPSSDAWTLFHGTVSGTTAIKGIYLEITSTKTSGSTEGIRAEGIGNAASGTQSIRGGNFKANVLASKTVNQLVGVYAQASYNNGSITATDVIGLGVLISQGDSLTASGDVTGAKIHLQTRGNESISGDHVAVNLINEAVGGNGLKLGAWILVEESNLSGGVHGADYLIDCGTNTDIVDTAVLRLGDDGAVNADAGDKTGTAAGFLTVVVGASTRYIQLYS